MVQINELMGNKKLIELLLFLIKSPSKEFSYTELRKNTKLAKATLTKWLKYLLKGNLVALKQIGLNKLYRVNKDNLLVKQLKILINLTELEFFAELSKKYNFQAYLFGSAARGENIEDSDFDILIIGNIKKEEIIKEIKKGLNIKLQIFSRVEWSRMIEKDKAFYERVEKDKILLR